MNDNDANTGAQYTEALPGSGDNVELEGCLLYVSEGAAEDRGKMFRLPRGRARIGKDSRCDLVLTDSAVSRQHTEVSIHKDGVFVEDLKSTNGTYYLGQRIERVLLKNGSRLNMGRCSIDLLPLVESEAIPISDLESYDDLVGSSVAMRRLYALLERLENSEAPVLIEGETGTGKELVARALHKKSPRAPKPFVVIDCGNMQSDLVKSELFGHKKGSFTGADNDRQGAFEAAHGGTIFLDEIGELPLDLQPKLLRVLETGEVQRVGDSQWRSVDVRLIAATHRNLRAEVETGRFREDLYYRLAVIRLATPALRERREDIVVLARHLAKQLSKEKVEELPPSVESLMIRHAWPGNVRELRNAVQRLLFMGSLGLSGDNADDALTHDTSTRSLAVLPDTSPRFVASGVEYKIARDQALRDFEQAYLKDLLEKVDGNISLAARNAGIDRKYLRDLLKKHGLYEEK